LINWRFQTSHVKKDKVAFRSLHYIYKNGKLDYYLDKMDYQYMLYMLSCLTFTPHFLKNYILSQKRTFRQYLLKNTFLDENTFFFLSIWNMWSYVGVWKMFILIVYSIYKKVNNKSEEAKRSMEKKILYMWWYGEE